MTIEDKLGEIGYRNAALFSDPTSITNYAVALYSLADENWKIAAFYGAVIVGTLFAAPAVVNYRNNKKPKEQ